MQSSRKKIYLLGSAMLLIAILVFWLLWQAVDGQKKINWREHYQPPSRDPYGLYVIGQMLSHYFPGQPFREIKSHIAKVLPTERGDTPASYVFIGEAMYFDTADIRVLKTFLEQGNTVFISCKSIPDAWMEYLYKPGDCRDSVWKDISFIYSDTVSLTLLHPAFSGAGPFEYWYQYKDETQLQSWHYLDTAYLCPYNDRMEAIGKCGELVNFLKINPEYAGTVFLHTTPMAFSNFHLRRPDAKAYADMVFSHLPEGPVYWDNFSHEPESTGRSRNAHGNIPSRGWDESPLAFMLSHPPLAWAWYLLLVLACLYLLFRGRRRQRILPVLPVNSNTSKEFIHNIGRLYYLESSPGQLAALKFRLFMNDAREKFHLPYKEPNDAFMLELSRKSGVEINLIREIAECHHKLPLEYDQQAALLKLHQLIELFYRQSRV